MISIDGEFADVLKKRQLCAPEQRDLLDNQIWERFGIECAIFVSDSSQFSSRAKSSGIIHYLELILRSHALLFPIMEQFEGELVKAEADNILAIFPSVEQALDSSMAMNRALAKYNASVPPDEIYHICIGIGWGKILRHGHEIFGDEANAAYKLGEDIARRDEILLTAAAYEKIKETDRYQLAFHKSLNLSDFRFDSHKLEFA